jgi:3-oxoacyl-[acyl-carrier-protein] synthase II
MKGRVAITGRGLLCALGDAGALVHQALCEGKSGLGPVELFETAGLARPDGGEIKGFDAKSYLGKKNMRPLDRTARLVTTAAHLALEDSSWNAEARSEHEIGLVLGTMYGSVRTIAEFDRHAIVEGPSYASPLDFANTVINAAAGQTAIWHGLRGINSTIATGQTSGLRAIAYATGLIESCRSDVLLSGGAEELCFQSFISLERARRLAGSDLEPVPFGMDRGGFLPGEGAGLLMLEDAELAARRGARVLARIDGCGVAFDPHRGQNEEQSVRASVCAVRAALSAAGIGPEAIGAISTSASGGPLDELEAKGLAEALGERAGALPVAAIKASLGETLGADGGLQAVVAVESLRTGELPGIRGLRNLRSGFPFPLAGSKPRPLVGPSLLLYSMGWDGQHCAVVISRTTES